VLRCSLNSVKAGPARRNDRTGLHRRRRPVQYPAWQRNALRQLCTQEKFESTNHAALLDICNGTVEAQPLTSAHIRDSGASRADVSLSALYALEHVNALAIGER
jgi:hypothetical protein